MCWNKGRLCWKIAKLFYFCHLKKLETFGPYYVHPSKVTLYRVFVIWSSKRTQASWRLHTLLLTTETDPVLGHFVLCLEYSTLSKFQITEILKLPANPGVRLNVIFTLQCLFAFLDAGHRTRSCGRNWVSVNSVVVLRRISGWRHVRYRHCALLKPAIKSSSNTANLQFNSSSLFPSLFLDCPIGQE